MSATVSAAPTSLGNILLVSNFPSDTKYAWWLMEQFWVTLSEMWAACNCKAYLAYPAIHSLSETIGAATNIEVVQLTVPGNTQAQRAETAKFISTHNIKTVYFTDRTWFSPSYLLLRKSGVKKILIHDHAPGDRPTITGWRRAIKVLRNNAPGVTADYMLCVSPLMRQRNILNGCLSPDRCLVVQNGIPALVPSANRDEMRSALGLSKDAVVVVTTGRAHPYKRFDFIIKTAHQIRKTAPSLDIHFLLIGDGPALNDLQLMVEQLELRNSVQLLGYRRDAQQLLFAADIAIHAALGEGFSLSILEYMSANLPVLVPDVPSVKQALAQGRTGLIFPPHDIESAAQHIIQLARNPDERSAMGAAAREIASTLFTLDRCLNDFQTQIRTIYSV